MTKPDNAELIDFLRILNEQLATIKALQALPLTDEVADRTLDATRLADAAVACIQSWRDAQLICAQLGTVH